METLTSGLVFLGFVIVVGIGVVIHYACGNDFSKDAIARMRLRELTERLRIGV
jgi:hypothetical protein